MRALKVLDNQKQSYHKNITDYLKSIVYNLSLEV